MSIGNDTFWYRRHLPHLEKDGKTYFITFRTQRREWLPPLARTATLRSCIDLHLSFCWLECVTIMPDHVHAILSPLGTTLAEVMKRMKGGSSYQANRVMKRRGPLWQHESFDHILRSSETLSRKIEYVCENPVRLGLVNHWREYPWTWRACDHLGPFTNWPAKAGPHT
jgi:REP element-mobilizing transposase RayT